MSVNKLRLSQALAVALNRRRGLSIVLVVDDAAGLFNPYTRDFIPAVCHVYVRLTAEILLDVDGIYLESEVAIRYLQANTVNRARVIELSGEGALAAFVADDFDYPLQPLSEEDINNAFERFETSGLSLDIDFLETRSSDCLV